MCRGWLRGRDVYVGEGGAEGWAGAAVWGRGWLRAFTLIAYIYS